MRTFERYHPAVKLPYFLVLTVFGMLFDHPACLALLFAGALTQNALSGGKRAWRGLLGGLLPLFALTVALNALTAHYGVTPLFRLPWGNRVTAEALLAGCAFACRLTALLALFAVLQRSVTFDEFLRSTGSVLPRTASMLALAGRYVPLYARRMNRTARLSRLNGDAGPANRFRQGADALQAGLSRAAEGSLITADSMASRGYGLLKPKRERVRLRRDETVCLIVLSLLFVLMTAGAASGAVDCLYDPVFQIAPATVFGVCVIAGYALFVFLPVIIRIREVLLWKRSGRGR